MRMLFSLPRVLKIWLIPILAGLGLAWLAIQAARAGNAMLPGPGEGIRIVEASSQGLTLELVVPDFGAEDSQAGGQPCQMIQLEGFGATETPGAPVLPVKGVMIGIPPEADLRLTVLEAELSTARQRYNLCPLGREQYEVGLDGQVKYRGEQVERDERIYAAEGYLPGDLAEIVSTGNIRSQRVAQIRFQPFQYNPRRGELRYYRSIKVRIDFSRPLGGVLQEGNFSSRAPVIEEGPFEDLLRQTLANYEQAREWRTAASAAADEIATLEGAAFKVLVEQDGIHQLTYARLQAAGVTVDELDPRTLRLSTQGQEVAIYVAGEADGDFGAQDYILFYGQKLDTKFSGTNVYWLTWGSGAGRRMPALSGALGGTATIPTSFWTRARFEEDLYYQPSRPSDTPEDRWYWSYINGAIAPGAYDHLGELHNMDTEPYSATVRGMLRSYSAIPQHHTRIYLNDHLIDQADWPSQSVYTFEVQVPQWYLVDGSNKVTVQAPLGGGVTQNMIYPNWFEIDYQHLYVAHNDSLAFDGDGEGSWEFRLEGFNSGTIETLDVTDPLTPARILGGIVQPGGGGYQLSFRATIDEEHHYISQGQASWLAPQTILADEPSTWRSASNGADYILITHSNFYTDVQPLADYRAAQGLRTVRVKVEDIYDEFSHGIFDPEAIRDFLAYAYQNWQPPAPVYVLLVGDGNYDFRNNFGFGEPNYVPPYLANVDPNLGEAPADNRYVSVSGSDILPDMNIGRLPVKTRVEASALVAKILNYEQNPASKSGEWRKRVLFVADNADRAGNFPVISDDIVNNHLPEPYQAQRVYYLVTHATPTLANQAIRDAINQGVLMVNYNGHSSTENWATERLWIRDDVASLNNADLLPFVAPMTCLEGYFVTPSSTTHYYSSLGESMVRASGKGAIASWSPGGLGVATGHDLLNRGLFDAIFEDYVAEIGLATTQSKIYLYSHSAGYRDLIETYTLFGDPATALPILRPELGITKSGEIEGLLQLGDMVTYTLVYSNSGERWTPAVISDTLPGGLGNASVTYSGVPPVLRAGTQFLWDIPYLEAGQEGMITITAQVVGDIGGGLINRAFIYGPGDSLWVGNNQAADYYQVIKLPLVFR